jgi:hypothetical protein
MGRLAAQETLDVRSGGVATHEAVATQDPHLSGLDAALLLGLLQGLVQVEVFVLFVGAPSLDAGEQFVDLVLTEPGVRDVHIGQVLQLPE